MAVAEQRDRKYSPCQKNAATAKQINNFCCDSLGKLIMPFPSGHNKDLEKLLRNFASCLSWQRSLWLLSDPSWLPAVSLKGQSLVFLFILQPAATLLLEMQCFLRPVSVWE